MNIRQATEADIGQVADLLYQVQDVHATGRPDLFVKGSRKYTDGELKEIFADIEKRPVFVAELDGRVVGYVFCIFEETPPSHSLRYMKSLYIDDLCVDESLRGKHIGKELYEAALRLAKEHGCYNLTLNVWSCNESAMRFYESCGLVPQKVGMEKIL